MELYFRKTYNGNILPQGNATFLNNYTNEVNQQLAQLETVYSYLNPTLFKVELHCSVFLTGADYYFVYETADTVTLNGLSTLVNLYDVTVESLRIFI